MTKQGEDLYHYIYQSNNTIIGKKLCVAVFFWRQNDPLSVKMN